MKFFVVLFGVFFTNLAYATGIDSNSISAQCDNATLSKYNGTANIEIDWEPNVIDLKWYNGDTQLSVQPSAQSCTYDGPLTIPSNPPTRTGYTFAGWRVMNVPKEYTRLNYLESTGTQCIDTNVYFDAGQDFRVAGTVINPNNAYRKIIVGTYKDKIDYNIEFGGPNYQNYPSAFRSYLQIGGVTTDVFASFSLPENTPITYDTAYNAANHTISNMLISNGSTRTYSISTVSGTGSSTKPLRFFLDYRESPGQFGITSPLLIGETKMFKDDILVGHFVPARRNSDNVLGMYDMVSSTFLTNNCSGSFVAQSPQYTQVEYLTSSGQQYIDTSIYFETTKDFRVVGNVINPSAEYRKIIIGNYFQGDAVVEYNIEFGGKTNNYAKRFRNYLSIGNAYITNHYANFDTPLNTLITYDTYYNATGRTFTNNLTVDGLTTTYSFAAISANAVTERPLRFFLDYRNGGNNTGHPVSIGVTKIWKDGALVGDFVPVRRNADNVLGFYNKVDNTFLTNGGTGSFVAGPDVGPLEQ